MNTKSEQEYEKLLANLINKLKPKYFCVYQSLIEKKL